MDTNTLMLVMAMSGGRGMSSMLPLLLLMNNGSLTGGTGTSAMQTNIGGVMLPLLVAGFVKSKLLKTMLVGITTGNWLLGAMMGMAGGNGYRRRFKRTSRFGNSIAYLKGKMSGLSLKGA